MLRRLTMLAAIGLAAASVASAYYHFLRYVNRDGQSVGLPQRFDLAALQNRTVPFFMTTAQPAALAAGDSMAALVSQVRLAARQWDEVDTSELRLQFGGFQSSSASQTAPGIDVIFDDIPPGLIALGGPTVVAEPTPGATFLPIQRSQVILPRDMSTLPSWRESTFLTLVHEFGHAIGLQHTLTSSVMSTQITRATSKGRALGADDVAGVSLLYPSRTFATNLGSIAGRITNGGAGVALASVVAIPSRGAAISVLSNPDGTYRIDGIPPGSYFVYAHPLPPAQLGEQTPANILYPLDADRRTINPSPAFDLTFFPGVREPSQATQIPVTPGGVVDNVNLSVTARRAPQQLFNISTFSFPGQVAVRPAYVNTNSTRNFLVATGNGILQNNQPVAGLQASVLGGATQVTSIRPYSAGYVQVDFGFTPQSGDGVRHLVFSTPNEVYVQPAALHIATRQPPEIASVVPGSDPTGARAVVITGNNLSAETTILFDGVPGVVRVADENGTRLVVLTPASASQRAAVTAYNPDGQSSLFLAGDNAATYQLDGTDAASFTISPATLAAGTETVVEITTSNLPLVEGAAILGFGSSEVLVKRVWVTAPNRAVALVAVSAQAQPATLNPSLVSGLQQLTAGPLVQITPATPPSLVVVALGVNPTTGIISTTAGNLLLLQSPSFSSPPVVTIADRPTTTQLLAPGIAAVLVPTGIPGGVAVMRVQLGTVAAAPIAVQIDAPVSAITLAGESRPYRPGDTVVLQARAVQELSTPFARPRVVAVVAGVEHLATVNSVTGTVSFTLLPAVQAGARSITLIVDGRQAGSVSLTVAP